MNAYELNRDSYEEYLKLHPDDPNADYIRRKIKVNGMLAECDLEDRSEMYNTGAFNEITAGYVKKAMRDLDFSQHQIDKVLTRIHELHDTVGAGEVVK